MVPSNYVKIFVCRISTDIKKKLTSYVKPLKKWIFEGVHLGGPQGGWYSQTMSELLSVKYLLISKKHWRPKLSRSKKCFLGGIHLGGPREGVVS